MSKTIIITENMATNLNEELSITRFKFKSNMKKFIAGLLEDPVGADPGLIFTSNGLDKNTLIKALVDNMVIRKKMVIDDHDADGNPHTAKMIVRYSVPKKRFNDKLESLFDVLFPNAETKIQLDEDGATSCGSVDGNGFGSGEFIQPLDLKKHKNGITKKTVGGDAFSEKITQNESITGTDIDKSAALYVYNCDNNGKWYILCAQRSNRKNDEEGGKWNPPMGHLHKHETLKEGALRECLEESGIDFSKYREQIKQQDKQPWGANFVLKLGNNVKPCVTIDNFQPKKGDEENGKFIWLPIEDIDKKAWAWTCGENAKKFINNNLNESTQLLNEAVKLEKAIKPFAKQMVGDEDEIQELQEIMMQADPTAYSNNFGQFAGEYYTWLGNQYMNGNIGSNDVTDLRRILDVYDKNSKEIGVHINQIGDLDLLIDLVRPYLNKNSNQNRDISKGEQELEKIYDDQNFTVYVPHTYRASRKIAGDTNWCTASSDGGVMFNDYLENYGGYYYVIVSKKNPSDKWQLHVESEQFQYKDSTEIKFGDLGAKAEVEPLIRFFNSIGLDVSLWVPKTWPDELEYKLAQGYDLFDIFDGVKSFSEGYAVVELSDRYNFVDKNNRLLSDKWFEEANSFSEGYARVELNGRWNFIDKNNRFLSDEWFQNAGSFSEGYACVKLNNRWNFIDKNNRLLSDKWFEEANSFSEGYARVRVNGRWNFIDKNNRLLSDGWFQNAGSFSEGYACVKLNNRWNFIDKNNRLLSDEGFEYVFSFSEGYAVVKVNGRWNFIDKNNRLLSDEGFEYVFSFSEGYSVVGLKNRWNFIDKNNRLLSDKWFQEAISFSEGYACVQLNGRWNFIDKNNRFLSDEWFEEANPFYEGYAVVKVNGRSYFVDRNGNYYDYNTKQPLGYDPHKQNNMMNESVGNNLISQDDAIKGEFAVPDSDRTWQDGEFTEPKKTGIGYKVFYKGKDGQLYPPMIANDNGAPTPVGEWLPASSPIIVGYTEKEHRPQVKSGGKGTKGGSGNLAFRPGWHMGEIPYAGQFMKRQKINGKCVWPSELVWAECEYSNDVDYQDEAMSYGYNANGNFQHSRAGLPKIPKGGCYRYRTNPNPNTVPWIIAGAMRIKRMLTFDEVDEILRSNNVEPPIVMSDNEYKQYIRKQSEMNESVHHLLTEAVKLEKAIKPFAKQLDATGIIELEEIMMQCDPTAYSNDFGYFAGDYYTWLGNQYIKGNISYDDCPDIKKALDCYDKNSKEIGQHISQIEDVQALMRLVDPYIGQNSNQNRDISKGEQELEKVYDDQNFTVYVPHTYRASRKIAGDTNWCTASSDGGVMFNEYLEDYGGQYYVIVSKKNPSDKWQLHVESEQFQYKDSTEIKFGDLGAKAEVEPLIRFFNSIGLDVSLWLPTTWPDELEYKLAQGYDLFDIFDSVYNFSEGYAVVELSGRWNFIDKNNRFLSDKWFQEAISFSEGYACVQLNGRWNFIDKNNRLLSDKWFQEAISFSEGYACVQLNGRWNFIDKNNRFLSDEWFEEANPFYEGYAVVRLNGRSYFVDRNGNYYDYNTKQPLGYDPHKQNNMMNESILTKYINNVVRQIIKETTASGTDCLPGEYTAPVFGDDETFDRTPGDTCGMHDRVVNSNI